MQSLQLGVIKERQCCALCNVSHAVCNVQCAVRGVQCAVRGDIRKAMSCRARFILAALLMPSLRYQEKGGRVYKQTQTNTNTSKYICPSTIISRAIKEFPIFLKD